MPITRKQVGQTPNTAQATSPPEEQSGFSKLRSWLGTGVRLGSGFLANAGGLPGAIAGGGGELVAQWAEGSLGKSTPGRVAVEAGIGSIPLGKMMSAGRAMASAGKSAGFNAMGDGMRQSVEGNLNEDGPGWDWKRTAMAAGGGGLIGGLLGKFAPGMPKEAPAAPKAAPLETVDNAGRALPYTTPDRANAGKQYTNRSGYQGDPTQVLADGATAAPSISRGRVPYGGDGVGNRSTESASSVAAEKAAARDAMRGQDVAAREVDRAARLRNAQEQEIRKAYGEAVQEDELRTLKEKLGLRRDGETIKSYTERLKGSTSDGRSASATINWANEADDAATGANRGGGPRRGLVLDENLEQPTAKMAGMQDDGQGGEFPLYQISGGPANGSTVTAAGLAKYGIVVPEDAGIISARANTNQMPSDVRMGELLGKLGGTGGDAAPKVGQYDELLSQLVDRNKVSPVTPGRVAGALPGDDELSKMASELGVPDDSVVIDPLARLLNAEVKNPGQGPRGMAPEAQPDFYRGPFNPDKGVTDDIPFDSPGGTGRNWVDEQLEYIDDLNADDVPSRFGGRKPRAYKPKPSVMKPADTEEQGLTDLLNFLGVDAAYAKGDDAFRKANGGVFGRTKAQAMASNSPEAGVGKAAKGKGPNRLNSESGKGGMFGSGSETGAVNPELLSTIAGGAIGGLVDAAWGDDSNPIEGILAGAAIGGGVAMAPKILESIGKTPDILQTPEGRKQAAEEFVNMIPQFQRFAYLSDARGLPANAIVGPYGAVLTGAIEAILSGDKRGWALLKEARNPLNFLKEMHTKENFNESMRRLSEGELGRAEGMPFKAPKGMPKSFEDVVSGGKVGLSSPGVYMNMGDLQARRMLQRAGFSDDEARRMTLTAEPRTATGKDLANMGRSGSPIWNIALPFKRTPANIMEEGGSRTPGLGLLVDYLSNKPTGPKNYLGGLAAREQIVQQAGGLGAGIGGYQLGQELDDPRSNTQNITRRIATNAAGRYGLPAHIGVLLGQTIGQDKGVSKQKIEQMFDTAIPVPGLDTFTDATYQALFNDGDFKMPRGFRPLRPFMEEEPTQPLSRYAQIRRR